MREDQAKVLDLDHYRRTKEKAGRARAPVPLRRSGGPEQRPTWRWLIWIFVALLIFSIVRQGV